MVAIVALALPAAAQPADRATLDREARQELVWRLSEYLREQYVFPDEGAKAAAAIGNALAAGEYEALSDPATLAARIQADLDATTPDKHLRIYLTGAAPPRPPLQTASRRTEAGIVRADWLAGGIGYIEVVSFPPPEPFKRALDRAMSRLEGSRALIVDVRDNEGGSAASVAYLVSYLVAPDVPVHVTDIVNRVAGTPEVTRESFYSRPAPVSFAELPLYVLTSHRTFSAGELFAYAARALKSGVLIGETTSGGAHPTRVWPLGHGLLAAIPFGRMVDPRDGSNWERQGVVPDVPVAAADALKIALERLGQQPVANVAAVSQQQVFEPRSGQFPGTEAAVRQTISGIADGVPNYAAMAPQFAEATRRGLPLLQSLVRPRGELQSISFREVDMMGEDTYDLVFTNGILRVSIALDIDGKIASLTFAPRDEKGR